MQVLIEHGHNKNDIINSYSREELALFYEKCIKQDMRHNADFIEAVMAGIGGAFGGGNKITKLTRDMRK
jgi:hypothetical protein